MANFRQDLGEILGPIFPISHRVFLHKFLGQNLHIKRRVFKVFFKRDFLGFSPQIYLVFSHKLVPLIAISIL